jgi:MFS family permease
MSPQISGLILIVTPVLIAIISPFAGTLSNRIAPQKLSAIGMGLVTVAIFVLVFLDEDTSFSVIIFSMVLQGLGFGLFLSPITKVIMGSAQRKFAHSSSATLSTLKVIGQTMSLGLLTVVFAIVMGSVQIIPQYYPLLIKSSQITCIIITILSIITFFLLLIGVKIKKMHN